MIRLNAFQISQLHFDPVCSSHALVIPITSLESTRWLPSASENIWIQQEEHINKDMTTFFALIHLRVLLHS